MHLCIAIAFAGPTSFDTITFEGLWRPAKTWVVTDASCALIGLVCAAFIKPSHVRTSCFRGRVLLDALGCIITIGLCIANVIAEDALSLSAAFRFAPPEHAFAAVRLPDIFGGGVYGTNSSTVPT